jgi:RNA polymerase sigma factor (sigma-70 family)
VRNPSTSDHADSTDQARWFEHQVEPHGAHLKAYLRSSFPSVRDIDDVVQESFLRIWKARAIHPIQSAKAFLFTIARRVAIDSIRHEQVSPLTPMGDLSSLSVIEDRADAADVLTREEKAKLLGQALGSLPSRCRDVIYLHKIKGLSQREVAEQLAISEKTVANQVGLGVKRCEDFFRKRGIEFY